MCGLAGLLTLRGEPASIDAVRQMANAVKHRGPDGEGVFVDGPCGLGHRRLAIMDLPADARQPMTDATGRYTIIYNGEIYNFKEIRQDLEAIGLRFRSRSDTEVLINAWAQWGA